MISLRHCLLLKNGGVVSIVGAGGKTSLMFRLAKELSEQGDSVLTTTTTRMLMPKHEQSSHVILSDSLDNIIRQSKTLLKKNPHVTAALELKYPRKKIVGFNPQLINDLYKSKLYKWIIVEADGAAMKPLKVPAAHEPVIPSSSKWVIGIMGLDAIDKPLNRRWVFRPELYSKLTGIGMDEKVTVESLALSALHQGGIFKSSPESARKILFLNKADKPGSTEKGRKIAELINRSKDTEIKRTVIGKVMHHPPVVEYYDVSEIGDINE